VLARAHVPFERPRARVSFAPCPRRARSRSALSPSHSYCCEGICCEISQGSSGANSPIPSRVRQAEGERASRPACLSLRALSRTWAGTDADRAHLKRHDQWMWVPRSRGPAEPRCAEDSISPDCARLRSAVAVALITCTGLGFSVSTGFTATDVSHPLLRTRPPRHCSRTAAFYCDSYVVRQLPLLSTPAPRTRRCRPVPACTPLVTAALGPCARRALSG
jgi:hypothetical protein